MQPKISREKMDFIYHCATVMEQVESASLHLIPQQSPKHVKTLLAVMMSEKVDADEWLQKHREIGRMKRESLIGIATAYCAQAFREYQAGNPNVAWTYLVEASYYAGSALFAKSLEQAWPEIQQATAKTAVAETRSKGGKVKNAGWKRIEDEAVRLITIHGERGQRWSTERKMAAYIRPELWPFAKHEVPGLSDARYVQTISVRLKSRKSEIARYLDKKHEAPC